MRCGLLGEKLGHSFSKPIHEKIGGYEYELKEIENTIQTQTEHSINLEEAKEAIKECHDRDIKVMLDLPSCISVDLYEGLHTILSEHNGITDDDKMVNLNVELEIKDNE